MKQTELLKGILEGLVLAIIQRKETYGYEITKILNDQEYKRRIAALPAEYRQVFQEIEKYAWHFSDHSGANMFNALTDLLDLFEEGAANGTPIKNITGEKVGDFAETIVNEVAGKWTDKQKEKLNHQFSKQ